MSGGGTKGAFEAGVLYGMYHTETDKTKFQYDVITGVSAGALNLGALSLFEKGQEEMVVDLLSEVWQTITSDNLYSEWRPAGIISGVLHHTGVFNTAPLYDFLTNFFNEHGPEIKKKIVVSSVDANTGAYTLFNETCPDPVKAIVSSAAIPFIFPSQVWENRHVIAIDGGSVWNTNLVSAVQRCREIVDDDSKITIDIIVCGSNKIKTWTN